MDICGFQKTTLLDYPGKVACTVFVAGCNFRCPYCYNHDLVLNPSKLPKVSGDEVFSFLERRRGVLDGVVVCGGEPILQKDLGMFLKKVKGMGFLTKIDTNGSQPSVLASLLERGLLDFVSLDAKAPLDERYCRAAGVGFTGGVIEQSIKVLVQSGIDFELRTTVVPTLHTKEDLVDLATHISSLTPHPSILKWYLQQFQSENCLDPSFKKIKPYSQVELSKILMEVKKYVPKAELRGI